MKRLSLCWACSLLLTLLSSCQSGGEGALPKVDQPICDLGKVAHGKTVYAEFVLSNPTDKPLKISRIIVSCACAYLNLRAVAPDGTKRTLLKAAGGGREVNLILNPGERAVANFRYETGERTPTKLDLKEPVSFFLDHPKVKRIDCWIKITIVTRLKVEPPLLRFGPFPSGQVCSFMVTLKPLPGAPKIGLSGFQGLNDKFKAQILVAEKSRVLIRFSIGPGLVPGGHSLPVILKTDVDGGYDLPLTFFARIQPNFSITPSLPINLEKIQKEGTASSGVLIKWHGTESGIKLKISNHEGPGWIQPKLTKLKAGSQWRMEMVYKPGPETVVPGPFGGMVTVTRTDKSAEPIKIPFKGYMER